MVGVVYRGVRYLKGTCEEGEWLERLVHIVVGQHRIWRTAEKDTNKELREDLQFILERISLASGRLFMVSPSSQEEIKEIISAGAEEVWAIVWDLLVTKQSSMYAFPCAMLCKEEFAVVWAFLIGKTEQILISKWQHGQEDVEVAIEITQDDLKAGRDWWTVDVEGIKAEYQRGLGMIFESLAESVRCRPRVVAKLMGREGYAVLPEV